jgi:TonB family protein
LSLLKGGRILALPMRRWTAITVFALCATVVFWSSSAFAQQPAGQRKILNQVTPQYPELARRMRLEGTVKLTVTVTPGGNAKSIQATGGSPLLLQAAQDAIRLWKWTPAPQESQEFVELRFHPN